MNIRTILCLIRGCDWNFGEVFTNAETYCKRCGQTWDEYMGEWRKEQANR